MSRRPAEFTFKPNQTPSALIVNVPEGFVLGLGINSAGRLHDDSLVNPHWENIMVMRRNRVVKLFI